MTFWVHLKCSSDGVGYFLKTKRRIAFLNKHEQVSLVHKYLLNSSCSRWMEIVQTLYVPNAIKSYFHTTHVNVHNRPTNLRSCLTWHTNTGEVSCSAHGLPEIRGQQGLCCEHSPLWRSKLEFRMQIIFRESRTKKHRYLWQQWAHL